MDINKLKTAAVSAKYCFTGTFTLRDWAKLWNCAGSVLSITASIGLSHHSLAAHPTMSTLSGHDDLAPPGPSFWLT